MLDILVPVLGRPRNVEPLLESLSVTVTPHRALFIATEGDREEIAALESAGAEFIVHPEPAGKGNFAKKINWGFSVTESPWVFQAADDVRFSSGWDTQALRLAELRRKDVIGTNDLHNAQVKRGIHATHVLFSRKYIEEQGGTIDGTGTVFCELYDHQYVDMEFCMTAKKRGVWAYCKTSVVEHLHPHWKLAPDDATYRKAMRNTGQDYRLYCKRMGLSRPLSAAERSRARRMARS